MSEINHGVVKISGYKKKNIYIILFDQIFRIRLKNCKLDVQKRDISFANLYLSHFYSSSPFDLLLTIGVSFIVFVYIKIVSNFSGYRYSRLASQHPAAPLVSMTSTLFHEQHQFMLIV